MHFQNLLTMLLIIINLSVFVREQYSHCAFNAVIFLNLLVTNSLKSPKERGCARFSVEKLGFG